VRVDLASAVLELLPQRAAWWPSERTLLVADLHLGKDAHFASAGCPVPAGEAGPTGRTLSVLDEALCTTRAERLIVLGDLFHAGGPGYFAAIDALAAWRGRWRTLGLTLVRGNHDVKAGDPACELGFECVDEPWTVGGMGKQAGLALCHTECRSACAAGTAPPLLVHGHIHPVVRLEGPAASSMRAPCFWLRRHALVLPAFGAFTGGAVVRPAPGDRVFIPGGGRVTEVALVDSSRSSRPPAPARR
jgi:DNA ligase-associated metallophosphoesterase